MVSAAKAFDKEPPKRPLTDLHAIVEDFQWRYVDRKKTDQVIEYCREADTFTLAVQRAVESRDAMGKHHNHQSKVDITARRLFGKKIVTRTKLGMIPVDDFDDFHDALDEIKPYGIGPVTVYDVAVRVGAYLGIEPQSVYMHAGVRQGMKSLLYAIYNRDGHKALRLLVLSDYREPHVAVKNFPKPLNRMKADDVEDILCTYREVFESW
jgi:hypothetical protein